jgi:hypothetical protein
MIQESFERWQEADERDGEQTLEGGRTASTRFKTSSVGIGIETRQVTQSSLSSSGRSKLNDQTGMALYNCLSY